MSLNFPTVSKEYHLYEQVEITSAAAQRIIEAHSDEQPRTIRQWKVAGYARDFLHGTWQANGSGVGFSKDGKLQNGHHRFRALILAGDPAFRAEHAKTCTVEGCSAGDDWPFPFSYKLDIAVGLDPGARRTHDKGIKRTWADDLRMDGLPYSTKLSALVTRLWFLDHPRGPFWVLSGSSAARNLSPTDTERDAYLSEHSDEVMDAVRFGSQSSEYTGLPASALGALKVMLQRADQESAEVFLAQFVSGAELTPGSPVWRLKRKLARMDRDAGHSHRDRGGTDRRLALACRAWNHFRQGTSPRHLQVPAVLTDRNFPVPM